MTQIDRRSFLAAIPAALALPRLARAADAEIDVFLDEPIGTISSRLHGHFVEHLGGVVYGGVWVGPDSKIANINGIRKALVDAMKPIGSTVVRWPGGCFADSYDWRDGVGPRQNRPRRANFWSNAGRLKSLPESLPAKNDPNEFGTNEFIHFCQLIGAEPYLAANLRALPPKDFYQWMEYCNSPADASTLGKLRAAGGDTEPFRVRFWGVGNESWGCGGEMTAAEYSVEYRRFTAWVPRYPDMPLSFVASGPNGGDPRWTHEFFSAIAEKNPGLFNQIWGWALHYYCGTIGRGDSLKFSPEDCYELLRNADRIEALVRQTWDIMGETDREHKVKLVVDEWGDWHNDDTAVAPQDLFCSIPTMRDALVAGLTIDTFHRHADKISMANVAQLVNCIQTVFLADGDRFAVTPTYHVFRMYKDHREGQAVRSQFSAPDVGYTFDGKAQHVVRLAGSTSVANHRLVLTAVNNSVTDALDTTIELHGGTAKEAQGEVLTAADIHAHNDFANPEAVKPEPMAVKTAGKSVQVRIPPCSVIKILVDLA